MTTTTVKKGFIQDFGGNKLLPITRAELVLDQYGQQAFRSQEFIATQSVPGLMSIDDKKILDNLKTTVSDDINKALESINQSLFVNNNQLNLFNSENFDPVQHKFVTDDYITITLDGNDVKWSLESVDNNHLPAQIIGKDLQNVTVSVPTKNEGEGESDYITRIQNYVAPIGYVDEKFNSVLGAINGLKFAGSLNKATSTNLQLVEGYFYICNEDVTITDDTLMETGDPYVIAPGDLIVAIKTADNSIKFTHIPSGDEIKGLIIKHVEDDSAVNKGEFYKGVPTLTFGSVFNITNPNNSNSISIDLLHASESNMGGYITKKEYDMFLNASGSAAITPLIVNEGYTIAEFIGKNENGESETKFLRGKSAELAFSDEDNGKITYTKVENDKGVPDITIKAGPSITLQQPLETNNEVSINVKLRLDEEAPDENSEGYTNYLQITNKGLEPILGSFTESFEAMPGLATTQDVVKAVTSFTTHWTTINNPLDITEGETAQYPNAVYWYGSSDLVNALKCNIFKNANE